MSPNPNHDEEGKFTTPPEEPANPWSAFEQAGITPDKADEVQRAYAHWQDLNNLDRRQQALQSVIRPDIDTWIGQQSAEATDPLAQYAPQPEYEEEYVPQQPQMPDFQEYGNQVVEAAVQKANAQWEARLAQMFAEQQITDAAQSAAKDAGLPPSMAADIEYQARQRAAQQPNRAPADLAREIASQRADELRAWAAQATPPPIGSPATPGGPVPSLSEAGPPDGMDPEKWALERSREGFG